MRRLSQDAISCETDAGGALVGLRVGALFAILGLSTLGICLPFFTYKITKLRKLYFLVRCFASGVVLATGYVHVLGDAAEVWENPCLYQGDYPWAYAIAAVSTVFTFTLEWVLHNIYSTRIYGKFEKGIIPNDDVNRSMVDQEKEAAKEKLDNTAHATTFEVGIIFHSIFIGLTLGITSDRSTLTALMIALMFHQACEGIALGTLFVKAEFSNLKYILFSAMFIVVTPIGIAIGAGININYQSNSQVALAFEAVFDSVSAGILLFNALVDLIIPCFAIGEMPKQKWFQALGFLFLYLGVGVMALIGKWA